MGRLPQYLLASTPARTRHSRCFGIRGVRREVRDLESADISREQPHPRGIMPDHLGHSNPVLSGRQYANWDFITAPRAPHGVRREDEVHRDI